MKRSSPAWLFLAAFAVAGCSGGGGEEAKEAAAKPATTEEALTPAGKTVAVPGIAMSWEGNSVHVGDAWEAAEKVFPEFRRGSYQLRSLPARFGREFEAHGWETNEGQGYGVITYKDLVIASIYHIEDVDEEHAGRLLTAQREGTAALQMNEVKSGTLSWNFWKDGGQRLMVLQDRGKKGIDVTILMGDQKVLDALGATEPVGTNPSIAPFINRPPDPGAADTPIGTGQPISR